MRDTGVPALGFSLGPAHQFDAFESGGRCERSNFFERQVGKDRAYETEFHHRAKRPVCHRPRPASHDPVEPPLEVGVELVAACVQPMPAARIQLQLLGFASAHEQAGRTEIWKYLIRFTVSEKDGPWTQFSDISHAMRLRAERRDGDHVIARQRRIDYDCPAEGMPDEHHAECPRDFRYSTPTENIEYAGDHVSRIPIIQLKRSGAAGRQPAPKALIQATGRSPQSATTAEHPQHRRMPRRGFVIPRDVFALARLENQVLGSVTVTRSPYFEKAECWVFIGPRHVLSVRRGFTNSVFLLSTVRDESDRIAPMSRWAVTGTLFFVCSMGWAQSNLANVSGRVLDLSDAVVAGAHVEIRSKATDAVRSATTNTEGLFEAANLPAGRYSVEVTAAGFSMLRRDLTVEVGQHVGLDLKLSVGEKIETVEIAGAAPILKTQDVSLGEVVEPKSIPICR